MLDAVVVGGGAAGLSAALYLGRMQRNVVVLDEGKPANRFSHAAHGFFTRDGIRPGELLQIGREQLHQYDTVCLNAQRATAITAQLDHFLVSLGDGTILATRNLLLATGLQDALPALPNIEQFWGVSVFHCPFCDGWEIRDQPVAIYGNGETALHYAKLLRNLTADLVICTGEAATFSATERQLLSKHGVQLIETPVTEVVGQAGQLAALRFADGTELARHALFTRPTSTQQAAFALQLGCTLNELGLVVVDQQARTSVTGVYAAGDMTSPARYLLGAAAQGAMAAFAISSTLSTAAFQ